MFKIQGTGCYDINVTLKSSSNSGIFPVFPVFQKLDGKVFCRNTMTFWNNISYKVNAFIVHYIWQLWLITYKNHYAWENVLRFIMTY